MQKIGSGECGKVYKISDTIARKVMPLEKKKLLEDLHDQIFHEVNFHSPGFLKHKHMVHAHEIRYNEKHQQVEMDMELAITNVEDLLKKEEYCTSYSKRYQVALQVLKDMTALLVYLHHNQIIARDIHPENILVFKGESSKNEYTYKYGDFGLACLALNVVRDSTDISFNQQRKIFVLKCLSPMNLYMAPEMEEETCEELEGYGPGIDIWALASSFCEILTPLNDYYFEDDLETDDSENSQNESLNRKHIDLNEDSDSDVKANENEKVIQLSSDDEKLRYPKYYERAMNKTEPWLPLYFLCMQSNVKNQNMNLFWSNTYKNFLLPKKRRSRRFSLYLDWHRQSKEDKENFYDWIVQKKLDERHRNLFQWTHKTLQMMFQRDLFKRVSAADLASRLGIDRKVHETKINYSQPLQNKQVEAMLREQNDLNRKFNDNPKNRECDSRLVFDRNFISLTQHLYELCKTQKDQEIVDNELVYICCYLTDIILNDRYYGTSILSLLDSTTSFFTCPSKTPEIVNQLTLKMFHIWSERLKYHVSRIKLQVM